MENNLVVIATTNDMIEAEFLRTHLEAEGFEVFIADEHLISANFFLANAIGGIKLKVPAEDAEDASAFVEELRNAEVVEDENYKIDTGWGECNMCQSRDLDINKEGNAPNKFLFFSLGVPSAKSGRNLVCNNCGNSWTES